MNASKWANLHADKIIGLSNTARRLIIAAWKDGYAVGHSEALDSNRFARGHVERSTAKMNAELEKERATNGGELPSERAMRLSAGDAAVRKARRRPSVEGPVSSD